MKAGAVGLIMMTLVSTSCGLANQDGKCAIVGKRLTEIKLQGAIYGPVGAKVRIESCPKLKIPFVFIGEEPESYSRLRELAEKKEDVVTFHGVADAFVVTEGRDDYILVIGYLHEVTLDTVGDTRR